jgi:mannose-6-phosphate isomerase-like protein (cupin superfamily)
MARVVKPDGARLLALPGRISREILSGEHGRARSCTLRRVEIPVARAGDRLRGRHCHDGHEECIYVVSGRGTTSSGESSYPLEVGDTILIPPGEMHVTRNTGSEPLVLLCFFPVATVSTRLEGEPQS